jgi:hypothetical protein
MAQVTAAAAPLDLQFPAGSPFALGIKSSFEDGFGNAIAWADITDWVASVGNGPAPTITSPSSGYLVMSWTATQTAQLTNTPWNLSCYVNAVGPFALMGGTVQTQSPNTPGTQNTSAAFSVNVGTGTATFTVSLA